MERYKQRFNKRTKRDNKKTIACSEIEYAIRNQRTTRKYKKRKVKKMKEMKTNKTLDALPYFLSVVQTSAQRS